MKRGNEVCFAIQIPFIKIFLEVENQQGYIKIVKEYSISYFGK
jgi:hypothetical protein